MTGNEKLVEDLFTSGFFDGVWGAIEYHGKVSREYVLREIEMALVSRGLKITNER